MGKQIYKCGFCDDTSTDGWPKCCVDQYSEHADSRTGKPINTRADDTRKGPPAAPSDSGPGHA